MNAPDPTRFVLGSLDRTRWFLPEHLTPLAHTPSYAGLPEPVRLRYNQLFASCYHEHFIFLEVMLASRILPVLIKRYADEPLVERLRLFIAEERVHTLWFHRLHQASEPSLYQDNYHYFIQVSPLPKHLIEFCASHPAAFPFCLWIAMIIEERTIPASREIIREPERFEPHYVALHRLHIADEARHVGYDAELLKRLWPALNPVMRGINRWMFVSILREFFQLPKRAGWRVILQLAKEKPEITPLLPRLRTEILALGREPAYLSTIYSRQREPRTFALADGFRELRRLEESLLHPEGIAV
jgi:hypothetical protein